MAAPAAASWQHLGYTMDGYTYTLRHDLAEEFKGSADRYEGQTYSYRVRARNSSGDRARGRARPRRQPGPTCPTRQFSR